MHRRVSSLTQTICNYVISQTPKHVRDMFNFNTTSNLCRYLVLFVSKTPSVVWYFIMDLIPPKVRGYFALFESKSVVIFICIHCLIISFKLRKFTQNLRGVFPSPNLNSYIVFVRHGSHWGGSPQNGLRDERTCRMTLASAYVLCHLSATWSQLQMKERKSKWK